MVDQQRGGKMGIRLGIASRYAVLTVSLVGLSSVAISFLLWKEAEKAIQSQWLKYGETMAQSIARQSERDLRSGDYSTLRTIVAQAAKEKDIQWLAIRDPKRGLIASLSKNARSVPEMPILASMSNAWHIQPEPDERADIDVEWEVPVMGTQTRGAATTGSARVQDTSSEPLGHIQLGLKQVEKGATTRAFLKSALLVIMGVLAFGAVIATGAIRGSARRLQDLLEVARASAPVGPDEGLDSQHRDEITQLAEAFVVLSARTSRLESSPTKHPIAASGENIVLQDHAEEPMGVARTLAQEKTQQGDSPIGVASAREGENALIEEKPIGVASTQEDEETRLIKNATEGTSIRKKHIMPAPRTGNEPVSKAAIPARASDYPGQYYVRVLLVEDDRVDMELEKQTLEHLGCQVELAWNGRQAVETYMRSNFDVVLMDCQMPEMDGYQASQVIRKMEATEGGCGSRTPIVAIVSRATRESRRDCHRAGMNDTVTKPFERDAVAIVLDRWLNEGQRVSARKKTSEEVALFPLPASLQNVSSSQSADGGVGAPLTPDAKAPEPTIHSKALRSIKALQRPGGPDIVARTIEFYLEDSLEMMKVLNEAVGKANPASIRGTAHRLKSSSANLGAMHLAELCKELEELGRAKTVTGSKEVMSQIEQEYDKVRSALSEHS